MAARKASKVLDEVIGYAEIAERMGVEVESVRIYRGRDPEFPKPVTPPSLRSPGFASADIDRYLTLREVRNSGRAGRPPKTAGSDRVDVSEEANERIRALIQAESTTAGIARLIGVTPAAIWLRLRGRTRWRKAELEAIAPHLGVTVEELLEGKKSAPAKRASRKIVSSIPHDPVYVEIKPEPELSSPNVHAMTTVGAGIETQHKPERTKRPAARKPSNTKRSTSTSPDK